MYKNNKYQLKKTPQPYYKCIKSKCPSITILSKQFFNTFIEYPSSTIVKIRNLHKNHEIKGKDELSVERKQELRNFILKNPDKSLNEIQTELNKTEDSRFN